MEINEKNLIEYLKANFEWDEKTATENANKILAVLTPTTQWIDVNDTLPPSQLLSLPTAPYYIVKTENFGQQRVMYLENDKGEKEWYSSYIAKLIIPVIQWREQ